MRFLCAFALLTSVSNVLATPVPREGMESASLLVKKSEPLNKDAGLVGAAHGTAFSDKAFSDRDGRITSLIFKGCGPGEHLTNMEIEYKYVVKYTEGPHGKSRARLTYAKTFHGVASGWSNQLVLGDGEFITQVDLTTWQAKTGFMHKSKRTRIGSIKLTTSNGQTMSCGASSATDPKTTWKYPGYGLLYFSGSAGDSLDALSANFIRVDKY